MSSQTVIQETVIRPPGTFFPNLNGLRFLAAFLVIISHTEQVKNELGLPNIYDTNVFIDHMGNIGVTLFFVLSGFLITYLLLAEKEKYGRISVKAFYMRRVLRIWPLYYLIVILALFVLPNISLFHIPVLTGQVHDNFVAKAILFLTILPNVASVVFPQVPYAGQLWSIGVEEQFYLLWPVLMNYTQKYVKIMSITIIVIVLLSSGFLGDLMVSIGHNRQWHSEAWFESARIVTAFFRDLRISCMAIGGLGAYILYFNKTEMLEIVFAKRPQIVALALSVVMVLRGTKVSQEFYAVFFIIIILNLAANPKRLVSLENPVLHYLGKISYGLYMYHNIAIILAIRLLQYFIGDIKGVFAGIALYMTVLVFTVILASVSYQTLEMWFMKRKHRFSRV